MGAEWYSPVCDNVLTKIILWLSKYEQGEVAATRDWVNLDNRVVKRPTMYGHLIAWRPLELQHLVRIIEAVEPKAEILSELKKLQANLKKGQLITGGQYLVKIAYHRQDIEKIFEILIKAKTGRQTIAETATQQKEQGKDLFEL